MKLTFRSSDGSLTIDAEPKSWKDAMDAIGCFNEYLMPEPCGCCKSKSTYARKKVAGEYTYFQWACKECGAEFYFGQHKEGGGLFPKRSDKQGPLPDRGWSIYKPSNGNGSSGSFGSDGYRDPLPSRQASEAPAKSYANDESIPF